MTNRRQLTHDANRLLREGDHEGAMRGFVALVRSAPQDLDARVRLADSLLTAGNAAGAIGGYIFVAREAALSGYPLKALVAVKILAHVDQSANELLHAMAQRYASGSQMLGRAVRVSPPDPTAEIPAAALVPESLTAQQVSEAAAQLVVNREGLPGYPASVAPVPLLSDLPPEAFSRMLAAVVLKRVPAGELLLAQGEPGDAFFMLARGSVRVSRREGAQGTTTGFAAEQDVLLATLGEGSIFGEMALLSGAPRGASVVAAEDSDVLVFGREALQAAASEVQVVAHALERFTRERLLSNLLATHALFKPFDRAQRAQLAARFSAHDALAGTPLIREGEEGRGLFVLLSGECDVSKIDGDAKVPLAVLKSGDVFGEIALLEARPTTATVTASRNSTVLFLSREVFERLVQGVPALREYFEQLAEERQMDTNLALANARQTESVDVEFDLDDSVMV